MHAKTLTVCAIAFCTMLPNLSATAATPQQVDAAIERAVQFLLKSQNANGTWEGTDPAIGADACSQRGGLTALVTYALLAAGETRNRPNWPKLSHISRTQRSTARTQLLCEPRRGSFRMTPKTCETAPTRCSAEHLPKPAKKATMPTVFIPIPSSDRWRAFSVMTAATASMACLESGRWNRLASKFLRSTGRWRTSLGAARNSPTADGITANFSPATQR